VGCSCSEGAEALLETRLPYLALINAAKYCQSTAIRSGQALLDDIEGLGRLNLYARPMASAQFRHRRDRPMDASLGDLQREIWWRNDIEGAGKLTKQGTAELDLTGEK